MKAEEWEILSEKLQRWNEEGHRRKENTKQKLDIIGKVGENL